MHVIAKCDKFIYIVNKFVLFGWHPLEPYRAFNYYFTGCRLSFWVSTSTCTLFVWNLSTFNSHSSRVAHIGYSNTPHSLPLHFYSIGGQMNGTSLLFVFLTHNLWLVIKISAMCLPIPFCTGISSSATYIHITYTHTGRQARRASKQGEIEICLKLRALRIEQYKKFVLQNRSANVSYTVLFEMKNGFN